MWHAWNIKKCVLVFNMCTCIYCVFVLFCYVQFFVTSVRVTAPSENSIAVNNNNNNQKQTRHYNPC